MPTRLRHLILTFVLLALIAVLLAAPALPYAQAARPDAPPFAERGPFAVGTRDLRITEGDYPLDVTIWYPAQKTEGVEEKIVYRWLLLEGEGRALLDAPPDMTGAPYPLIVFSHGLSGLRYQSVSYTEHLASWGFVVMAADHPGSTFADVLRGAADGIVGSFARRPLEVLREIAFAETLTGAGGTLPGLVDTNTIGVSGHSFGGYTTLSVAGARLDADAIRAECPDSGSDPECALARALDQVAIARGVPLPVEGLLPPTTDPRVKAAVALAPSSGPMFGPKGAAALEIPLMIIVGSQDRATVPERDAYPVYTAVGSREKALVVLENAGHYIFVEKCPAIAIRLGRFAQCSDLVWDMDRAHDITNHFGAAFFLATLKNSAEARAALDTKQVDLLGVRYEATLTGK